MNLSKKLLTAAFVVAASVGLQAGTLYWQINNNPNNDQYAAVAILKNGELLGYANQLNGDGGESIGPLVSAADAMANTQYADLTGYEDSQYTFVVEMLSLNTETEPNTWDRGWTSGLPQSYSALSGSISEGGITAGSVNAWTSSVTIPEPTSGLLLLVGGSLLALRRKRRA